MNKNFRTPMVYDPIYGVDVVDAKGNIIINFRTYAAARMYMDAIAAERAKVISENHAQDLERSRVINENMHRDKWHQVDVPEVHHKRPPALVTLRTYAPCKAPALTPA